MTCPYPKPAEGVVPVRPIRIWDARARKHLAGRQFVSVLNAHDRALILVRWEKVGTAYEVYDVTTGQLLGQYLRTPTTVKFVNITHSKE
jgi:hypothetical protein